MSRGRVNPCGHSPYVTWSLTRRRVCILRTCLIFYEKYISHIQCYCMFFLLHYTQVLCQYRLYRADHAYLTYLMLQRQLTHLNGRKLDHSQVWASYIFLPFLSLSHIATDGRSVSQSVGLGFEPTSGAHDQIFITVWQLQSCYSGAPSLTRGRVCLSSESLSAVVKSFFIM
jgi:hypothetical protein